MSSSKGVVLTARELLDITPPEIMRFLVANNKPRKAIQFDTGEGLIGLADEYERLGGQIPTMLKDIEEEEISRRKKKCRKRSPNSNTLSTKSLKRLWVDKIDLRTR